MINIKINNTLCKVKKDSKIMEIADQLHIYIPRFCYHKKLSIVANCRMCLVEVTGVNKLVPACKTYVTEGMEISTNSSKVIASQKSVLELLLANHPLDCPICDKAGECELQDLALQSGPNVSQYQEDKSTIIDENFGPLIATNMTRCIQCTRCVRFLEEIAGTPELAVIGKSENTRISTFPNQTIISELSGNIIDLCPVGALTPKPLPYNARSWQFKQVSSISFNDCIGSNIYYHVYKEQIVRAVPKYNPKINDLWLSDRDRFGFIGVNSQDRLKYPLLKKENKWFIVSWQEALSFIHLKLSNIIDKYSPSQLGGLLWPHATLEEYCLIKKLFDNLGSSNLDHRLKQLDFRGSNAAPSHPNLGLSNVADLATQKLIILIGCNLHQEQPIASIYIRSSTLNGGKVIAINPIDFKFNFEVYQKHITPFGDLLLPLIQIVVALLKLKTKQLSIAAEELLAFVKGILQDTELDLNNAESNMRISANNIEYLEIAKMLLAAEGYASIILGSFAITHPEYSIIVMLSNLICLLTESRFGTFSEGSNSAGAWLSGCVSRDNRSLNSREMIETSLKAYLLLGIEPEIDYIDGRQITNCLKKSELIVALSCFESDFLLNYSDVILPMASPVESTGTYVNITGIFQHFNAIVSTPGESKTVSNIIIMLAEKFGWNFNKLNLEQYIKELIKCSSINTLWNNQYYKEQFTNINIIKKKIDPSDLIITNVYLYGIDPIVRRSECLQKTLETSPVLLLNIQDANKLNLTNDEVIKISPLEHCDNFIKLPIKISNTIPEGCVFITQAGMKNFNNIPYSHVKLEKATIEKHYE